MGRWSLPIKNMKIQFTAEEIAQALKEYCRTYQGLELDKVELNVSASFSDEYGNYPEHDNVWATADFKIIP